MFFPVLMPVLGVQRFDKQSFTALSVSLLHQAFSYTGRARIMDVL